MKRILVVLLALLPLISSAQKAQSSELGKKNMVLYSSGMLRLDTASAIFVNLDTVTVKAAYPEYKMFGRVAYQAGTFWVHNGVKFTSFGSGGSGGSTDSSVFVTLTRLQDSLSHYVTKLALNDSLSALRAFIAAGQIDTTSLSNRINQRVKYTDTAAMLLAYARKQALNDTASALRNAIALSVVDTTSLSNRINQRVRYSDTAAMLSPYATKAKVLVDSNALATNINARVKYTDTSAMLAPYATKANLKDTSTLLRSLITSSVVDTTSLSNRINQRVRYTDTASMLNSYARRQELIDTAAAIRSVVNTKVNTSDFNTLFDAQLSLKTTDNVVEGTGNLYFNNARARSAITLTTTGTSGAATYNNGTGVLNIPNYSGIDTISLSNRIEQRVKYTDTATMLTPYTTFNEVIQNQTAINQAASYKISGQGTAASYIANDITDPGTPFAPFMVNRTVPDGVAAHGHGYKDNTIFQRKGRSYGSFDCRVEMAGDSQGHLTQFQMLGAYTGTDTMDQIEGFAGGADVRNSSGYLIQSDVVAAYDQNGTGKVGTQRAVHIYPMTRGVLNNWAIYSEGSATPSWHAGNVKLGGTKGVSDTNTRYNLLVDTSIKSKYSYASYFGTDDNTDLIFVRNKAIAGYISAVGRNNTVYGLNTLPVTATGSNITTIGEEAGNSATIATAFTAIGSNAMQANRRGNNSTVVGVGANAVDTNSNANAAFGRKALQTGQNVTGSTGVGAYSGARNYGNFNTLLGYWSGNGEGADMLGNNNIHIGANTTTTATNDSNTLNIGNDIFGTNINYTGKPKIGIDLRTPDSTFDVNGSFQTRGNASITGVLNVAGRTSSSYYNWMFADATGASNMTTAGIVPGETKLYRNTVVNAHFIASNIGGTQLFRTYNPIMGYEYLQSSLIDTLKAYDGGNINNMYCYRVFLTRVISPNEVAYEAIITHDATGVPTITILRPSTNISLSISNNKIVVTNGATGGVYVGVKPYTNRSAGNVPLEGFFRATDASATALNIGSTNFYVNRTTGKTGIGTAADNGVDMLQVAGSSTMTGLKVTSLTSGTTNDSLVVADASTGLFKRISSSRISGSGGTPTLAQVLAAGNNASNRIKLTSDTVSFGGGFAKILQMVSSNFPGFSLEETASGSGHGWGIGMQNDRALKFFPFVTSVNSAFVIGNAGITEGISISNSYAGCGIRLQNTVSGGKDWYIFSTGDGYGAPKGSLAYYGGDAGYNFTMTKEGRVIIGAPSADDGGTKFQSDGSIRAGLRLLAPNILVGTSSSMASGNNQLISESSTIQSGANFGSIFGGYTSTLTSSAYISGIFGGSNSVGGTNNYAFAGSNTTQGGQNNVTVGGSSSVIFGTTAQKNLILNGQSAAVDDGRNFNNLIGAYVYAQHSGCFLAGDSVNSYIYSDVHNQFKTRFAGGYKLNIAPSTTAFEIDGSGNNITLGWSKVGKEKYTTSTSTTVTATLNEINTFYGGSASVYNIPAASSTYNGQFVEVENAGTANVTITSAATDIGWVGTTTSTSVITPGSSFKYVCRNLGGTYYWYKK